MRFLLLLLTIFVFLPIYSKAQYRSYSAASLSLAHSGRASVHAGDIQFMNPASLVHLNGRYLSYSNTSNNDQIFTFSDNTKESALPGAISYFTSSKNISTHKVESTVVSVTLAEFIVEQITFGITGHQIKLSLDNTPYQLNGLDAGVLYTPFNNVGLGFVCYMVLGGLDNLPTWAKPSQECAIALNYLQNRLQRYQVDILGDTLQLGAENYFNEFLPVRVGYEYDNFNKISRLSAGLGFEGPRFSIIYGYIGNTENSTDYLHKVDLIITF